MVRAVDDDFKRLVDFISTYSTSKIIELEGFVPSTRITHKHYVPLLQILAETNKLATSRELTFFGDQIGPYSKSILYLQECVSDIGCSLFCSINGAYKPADMLLRSAIENFMKFAVGASAKKVYRMKNVYEIFELFQANKAFDVVDKKVYELIRFLYVELCKTTHTASVTQMAKIHSLNSFPGFHQAKYGCWVKNSTQLIVAFSAIIVAGNKNIYLGAHYKSREIIEAVLPKPVLRKILAGEI